MMIYFKRKRFAPEFRDVVKVENLESECSNLTMTKKAPAYEIIADWLKDNPEGGVDITTEER